MSVEVITKEDLEVFRVRLLADIKKALQPMNAPKKEWLRSKDVRKLLNISPNTLQTLRISRRLQPTRIGGILFYRLDEIEKMMDGGKKEIDAV
ncbi:MAG TPA: helix-turn-helix domain-containing protein [Puia sp.]|nr:helix-turn-helix domain-containing protein [Puia sp.]